MRRALRVGALACAAALALAGCGAAPESGAGQSASGSAQSGSANAGNVKACMVSDSGGFDDKSFNQSGYEGLQRAVKQLGVTEAHAESQSDADYAPNINNMVQQKCNLIIGVGFLMADAMDKAAAANPDIKFALVDSTFTSSHPNARALVFNTAQAAYLAGYAAAGMTQSGKVGTFLGGKIPTTMVFADGFADGVAKYNEAHGTSVKVLGWDKAKQNGAATGDFEDVAKGQQYATQLVNQGADIIMPVAGPVGAGALAAATAANKTDPGKVSVVWVDADGYLTQPQYRSIILTSVIKEIGNAVFDTVKSVQQGKFSNKDYVGTIANKGVGIAPFHDFSSKVPNSLKSEIQDLQSQIGSGEITVESANSPK